MNKTYDAETELVMALETISAGIDKWQEETAKTNERTALFDLSAELNKEISPILGAARVYYTRANTEVDLVNLLDSLDQFCDWIDAGYKFEELEELSFYFCDEISRAIRELKKEYDNSWIDDADKPTWDRPSW